MSQQKGTQLKIKTNTALKKERLVKTQKLKTEAVLARVIAKTMNILFRKMLQDGVSFMIQQILTWAVPQFGPRFNVSCAGGEIKVSSKENNGSEFIITLPL